MTKEQTNGYAARVSQANASELVVILYEMIDECLQESKEQLRSGDMDSFLKNVTKAREFLNELMGSLDYSYSVSFELFRLYVYADKQLVQATASKTVEPVDITRSILNKLHTAFAQVAKEDTSGPVMKNTEAIYAGLTYGKGTLNESVESSSNRGYQA